MKKKNYVKFALDLIMALLFVLFFNKQVLGGLTFHEIAGLGFAAAYFTHIFLNLQWVKKVTLNLFNKKLPWKTRGNYLLNLLLLVSMSFIIISGVLVSRVIFPNIHVANERWFQMTHISISFVVLILVGIHVGLHWQWVVNVWKKTIWKHEPKKVWIGYAMKGATVLILLFGLYKMSETGFVNRLSSSGTILGIGSQEMSEGGRGMKGESGDLAFKHSNSDSFRSASGERPTNFKGNMGREHGGGGNGLDVIVTYTGIMAVFVILTYYLKKLTGRMKKNKRGKSNQSLQQTMN
ncbi:DUF4405 domain-containing protein [Peribacillus asahii]|uniref:DUF4405 domain-containing protein n=1 Tax=Peribacillus asahii TaxID=228899 RepID=UPI0020794C93|nr:DUF4405 domain-containing protein [Peribacillus asahii]USK59214.1 DUF4405 domain-containing protein [Peribacillus asahii]